jgi:hypothetical protein
MRRVKESLGTKRKYFMASGTAPALDPNLEKKTEASQDCATQPQTFAQRFKSLLHKVFEGREEYLGWHQ